jgi:hypothetical protein
MTGLQHTANLCDQFRKLAERAETTAVEWQATGGPKPLPGWTNGVWAARREFIWRNIDVPAGTLVWLAYDQGSFKSFPRIRRFVGNWQKNMRAKYPGSQLSHLQGSCFNHLASFYHQKIVHNPWHPANEFDELLVRASVACALVQIIESEDEGDDRNGERGASAP